MRRSNSSGISRTRRALIGLVVVLPLAAFAARAEGPWEGRLPEPELESPYQEALAHSAAMQKVDTLSPSDGRTATSAAVTALAAPTFFPNNTMTCSTAISGPSGCGQLLEPEVASAPDGTIYVTAQEGVPAGVNIWRRDPGSYEYKQLPKPDADEPLTSATGLALGGGDNDLAITTDGRILVASLSLVSAPVSYSTDRGQTFTKNQFANGLVNVDRQWMTTVGKSTVYLSYHDNEISQIWLVKSTDGGANFGSPQPVIPPDMLPQMGSLQLNAGNVQGDIVATPDGRVVIPFLAPKEVADNVLPLGKPNAMFVAITDKDGNNPVIHKVFEGDDDIMGLFPAVASDRAGNLYASWTNKHGVFLSISRDQAVTWSAPRKISSGAGNLSTVFPFVIAGTQGRVALAWLGSSAKTNDDEKAEWRTYFAMTTNALKKNPTWRQVVASDHVVHTGSICLEGILCDATGGDRSLAEVVEMGLTKDGRVIISYPDSSTGTSWTYLAEQRFGPGLLAGTRPSPPPLPDKPGGPVYVPTKRLGPQAFYFTAGGAGTGLEDSDGNEIDAPGDTGAISTTVGNDGHVASGNVWTTSITGLPLVFEGAPVAKNTNPRRALDAHVVPPGSDGRSSAGNDQPPTLRRSTRRGREDATDRRRRFRLQGGRERDEGTVRVQHPVPDRGAQRTSPPGGAQLHVFLLDDDAVLLRRLGPSVGLHDRSVRARLGPRYQDDEAGSAAEGEAHGRDPPRDGRRKPDAAWDDAPDRGSTGCPPPDPPRLAPDLRQRRLTPSERAGTIAPTMTPEEMRSASVLVVVI
jgi:hypothetical protein